MQAAKVHSTKPLRYTQPVTPKFHQNIPQKIITTITTYSTDVRCPLYKKPHSIRKCQEFMDQLTTNGTLLVGKKTPIMFELSRVRVFSSHVFIQVEMSNV